MRSGPHGLAALLLEYPSPIAPARGDAETFDCQPDHFAGPDQARG